jgi:preprotein translocase SecE subunit
MNSIVNYINGALEELRQVRWPTRQQAIRFSGIVIVFVLACSALFGAIDFGLSELMQAVLNFI